MPWLAVFVVLEVPVLFFQAATSVLLRAKPPEAWLPKLLAFQFPVVFLGAVGLPLWALWKVLAQG